MYADDSSYVKSLQRLIKDTFSVLSGLKPNHDKCTILRIGSLKIQLLHYLAAYL
jgi:hypothetical protein